VPVRGRRVGWKAGRGGLDELTGACVRGGAHTSPARLLRVAACCEAAALGRPRRPLTLSQPWFGAGAWTAGIQALTPSGSAKSSRVGRQAGRMAAAPVGSRRPLILCQLGMGAWFVARICAHSVCVRSVGVRPLGRARGCRKELRQRVAAAPRP
jgi:hypothetical protein